MSILDNASIINSSRKIFGNEMLIQFRDSSIQQININEDPIAYNNIQARPGVDSILYNYQDIMYGKSMQLKYI